jgi:hypothetical protein
VRDKVTTGFITGTKDIYFPKELIGKRVRFEITEVR